MHRSLPSFLRDLSLFGLSDGIAKLATFSVMLLYTRFISPVENGVWTILVTLVSLLTVFLTVGVESTYMRFFLEAKSEEQQRSVTSSWIIFLFIWALVGIAVLVPLRDVISRLFLGIDDYGALLALAFITIPVTTTNRICGQALRNQFRIGLFASLNLLSIFLTLSLNLLLVTMGYGVFGLVLGTLVAAVCVLPIRLYTARSMLAGRVSIAVLKEMIRFGVPLIFMEFAYWVFVSSDKFILGKLSTFTEAGYYGVATTIVSVFTGITAIVGQTWPLHITKAYENRVEGLEALCGRFATYLVIGFGLLAVGITTFSHELLVILSRPTFYRAELAVGPLALAGVALATTQVTSLPISLTKKTQYFVLVSWSVAIINVILNILLIPTWGMLAASWVSTFCYTLVTLSYILVSRPLMSIQYELRRVIPASIVIITFTLFVPMLPQFNLAATLILKTLYFLLSIAALCITGAVDKREWKAVHGVLQNIETKVKA